MSTTVSEPASNVVVRPGVGSAPATRITSIDAFRGFVMFLMLAEAMRLWTLHRAFPDEPLLGDRGLQHDARAVAGMFAPRSDPASLLVSRRGRAALLDRQPPRRGESFGRMLGHAVWRSAALILLGIFLRSMESPHTYWTFEDTLTQIGLGYTFLFLLGVRVAARAGRSVFTLILVGFWGAFALYPLPGPDFDYTQVGVPANWPHLYTGFLAHFNKNSNLSWAFDVWFLNLFPREAPFRFNEGGWSTLSFIPTLATMQLGMWAGRWLQTPRSTVDKLKGLIAGGVALTLAGLVLQWLHICPDREAHLDLVVHPLQWRAWSS